MDIDEERLSVIHRLATRYADELGVDLTFEATTKRELALQDADFVINTALSGGHDRTEAWRYEATQHGYYRGLRHLSNFHQYHLMVSVAQDMERICPNAWLIQSSNPVYEGCTLMTRETSTKIVGLCHGFYGYHHLANAIGVPPEEIEWEAPGVNHWIYLTQFRHKGENLYPRIDQWIEEKADEYWQQFRGRYGDTQLSRAAIDHYRRVGLMPIGDASRTFTEWYYHTDFETKRKWYGHIGAFDSEIGWGQYVDRLTKKVADIRAAALDDSIPVTQSLPLTPVRELQIPIMDSITNDTARIIQVNVPNRGAIEGIAPDVVVEGKALVDGAGIHLLQVGKLPDKLMHMVLLPRILKAEKELLAYQTGDRDLLVSSVLDDHQSKSLEQAEALVDHMLDYAWDPALKARFTNNPKRRPLGEYDLPNVDDLLNWAHEQMASYAMPKETAVV
jgi:alpha-galactosidase